MPASSGNNLRTCCMLLFLFIGYRKSVSSMYRTVNPCIGTHLQFEKNNNVSVIVDGMGGRRNGTVDEMAQ